MNPIEAATGLTPIAFAIAAALTLGAAAVRGLTGFGMAIILVPLLSLLMRPDDAVVLAILLQLMIGPIGMRSIVRDSDRRTAVPIAITAIVTCWFGIRALAHTPPDVARVMIAGIALAAFVAVVWPVGKGESRPALPLSIATGAAAGLLTGFAAMPGPPVVPFYIRSGYPPATARASMLFIFFATAIAGTFSAWLQGLIQPQTFILALFLFPAVLIGNWAGGLAFGRVPPALWRSLVGLVLGAAAVSAVLRLV